MVFGYGDNKPLITLNKGAKLGGTLIIYLDSLSFSNQSSTTITVLDCVEECTGNFSSVQVKTDREIDGLKSCQSVDQKVSQSSSSLSIVVSTNSSRCSSVSKGVIIGLCVGLPLLTIIFILVFIYFQKYRREKGDSKVNDGIKLDELERMRCNTKSKNN